MPNTIRVPRTHLILALCLPLAVLIGYFLAEPAEPSGLAILTLVLTVLSTPLLIKYHHPLLVLAWNAYTAFAFLPGRPGFWMLMAFISLMVSVFNRATDPDKRFLEARTMTKALVCLAVVVGVTALLTGGVGFRIFGSSHYGGRYYLEIAAAIAGYFALTAQRIPLERAGLYVGLFFLSALTALMSNLIYTAGPSFYFLYAIFPANSAIDQAIAEASLWRIFPRFGSFSQVALGLLCWVLARYGMRGTCDCTKPWRLAAFLLAGLACLLSGFRSNLILFLLVCLGVFTFEGLWRSRALPLLLVVGATTLAIVLPHSDKLPPPIQRCLCFLPVKVDPAVAEEARHSAEWRLDMWRGLTPQIPKYLLKGKGYTFDASDLARAEMASTSGFGVSQDISAVSMEYHNGPLSVLIPFGIPGLLAFLWFIGAGLRLLYCNYRFGNPALGRINTLLLAAFAAKALFFFVVFGALHAELYWFTGLLGLSVSLNGGVSQPAPAPAAVELEALQSA